MKRLALIGGCLEPGRDGVGDYLAQLAEAAVGHGVEVTRIGLRDWVGEQSPELLRLDREEPWRSRLRRATTQLQEFEPDWISWHLVPYAYHPKGVLPAELGSFAAVGTVPGRRHVFLHELWVGAEVGAPLRHRFWRLLQRPRLLRFLRAWQPDRVDTSNVTYQAMLARAGQPAGIVPLFGNLPVAPVAQAKPPAGRDCDDSPLVAAFFGTLHPQWDPHATSDFLQAIVATGRPVHCLGLGRLGPHGERWFANLPAGLTGEVTGSRPAAVISAALQAADFGVATHPWALLGKSGAVATYLDHGLPVLATRDDWRLQREHPNVPAPGPGIARLGEVAPESFAAWVAAQRRPPASRRDAIVGEWLRSLQEVAG